MKLIDITNFEDLSRELTLDIRLYKVVTRIELYSCKMAGDDKSTYRKIVTNKGLSPSDLQPLSPPKTQTAEPFFEPPSTSSSSRDEKQFCDTITVKTLFYLVATLNASFGFDYDFSNVKSSCFKKEASIDSVKQSIDNYMTPVGKLFVDLKPVLWQCIDREMQLANCKIYSYDRDRLPDLVDNNSTFVWAFVYFFYNKKTRRVLFFSSYASSIFHEPKESENSGALQFGDFD